MRSKFAITLSAVILFAAPVGYLAADGIDRNQPTRGPLPADVVVDKHGRAIEGVAPDYISTLDRDGQHVGYVKAEAHLVDDTRGVPLGGLDSLDPKSWEPVYGEDLTTVIGHMVPRYGFLPDGAASPTRGDLTPVDTDTP